MGPWIYPLRHLNLSSRESYSFNPKAYTVESNVVTYTRPPEMAIPLKWVNDGIVSPLENSCLPVFISNAYSTVLPACLAMRSAEL